MAHKQMRPGGASSFAVSIVALVLAAIVALIIALFLQEAIGGVAVPLAFGGVIGVVVLCVLPRHWLPAIALLIVVLFPRRLFAEGGEWFQTFAPATLVIVIWAVRSLAATDRKKQEPLPLVARLLILAVVLCVVVLTITSSNRSISIHWALAFGMTCIVPLLVPDSAESAEKLKTVWVVLSVVMALYCGVEFLLQSNPLYDSAYDTLGERVQHWAVYRSTGSLGHPLYAGLFFAMAFGIAFGRRFEGRSNWYILAAGANVAGILFTVSRNSFIAIAVVLAVIVIPSLFRRARISFVARMFFAVAIVGLLFVVVQSDLVQLRGDSREAETSSLARTEALRLSFQVAGFDNYLGAGPGMAQQATAPYNIQGVIIESAPLQLLVSLGIPGVILVGVLIALGIWLALVRQDYAAAGALAAYATSAATFNILESNRPAMLFLGLALFMSYRARLPKTPQELSEDPDAGAGSLKPTGTQPRPIEA